MAKDENATNQVMHPEENPLPPYVPPQIVTYTAEQIVEEIGPALACSGDPCAVTP